MLFRVNKYTNESVILSRDCNGLNCRLVSVEAIPSAAREVLFFHHACSRLKC